MYCTAKIVSMASLLLDDLMELKQWIIEKKTFIIKQQNLSYNSLNYATKHEIVCNY